MESGGSGQCTGRPDPGREGYNRAQQIGEDQLNNGVGGRAEGYRMCGGGG